MKPEKMINKINDIKKHLVEMYVLVYSSCTLIYLTLAIKYNYKILIIQQISRLRRVILQNKIASYRLFILLQYETRTESLTQILLIMQHWMYIVLFQDFQPFYRI